MFFKTTTECMEMAELFGFAAEPERNAIKKSTGTFEAVRVSFAKRGILDLRTGATFNALVWPYEASLIVGY